MCTNFTWNNRLQTLGSYILVYFYFFYYHDFLLFRCCFLGHQLINYTPIFCRSIPRISYSYVVVHSLIWRRLFLKGNSFLFFFGGEGLLWKNLFQFSHPRLQKFGSWLLVAWQFSRRQDSSIGFGAPVRMNMQSNRVTDALVTSSLLESVRIKFWYYGYKGSSAIVLCLFTFGYYSFPFYLFI